MTQPTIDLIKDITVERQVRKLASVIDKQNEKVDKVDSFTEDIENLKTDVATLKANDTVTEQDITSIKNKNTEQDTKLVELTDKDTEQDKSISDNTAKILSVESDLVATETEVAKHQTEIINLNAEADAIRKSLLSDVIISKGTNEGTLKVSVEREDNSVITSTDYNYGKNVACRMVVGSSEGMVKTILDLSDGISIESNEIRMVEVLESDIYVSAITLVANAQEGTISGSISYSNGTTQEINKIYVPTALGVTANIESLLSRMTNVETTNTEQGTQIDALDKRIQVIEDTPGVGQFAQGKLGTIMGSTVKYKIKAETDGSGSVNGLTELDATVEQLKISDSEHTSNIDDVQKQVSDLATEVVSNSNQIAQHTNQIGDCFNSFNVEGKSLKMTTVEGVEYTQNLPGGITEIEIVYEDASMNTPWFEIKGPFNVGSEITTINLRKCIDGPLISLPSLRNGVAINFTSTDNTINAQIPTGVRVWKLGESSPYEVNITPIHINKGTEIPLTKSIACNINTVPNAVFIAECEGISIGGGTYISKPVQIKITASSTGSIDHCELMEDVDVYTSYTGSVYNFYIYFPFYTIRPI